MKKLLGILYQIERSIAALAILVMAILVVMGILSREVLGSGLLWTTKWAVFLMIWAGFLGATLSTHKDKHLRPEIADKLWAHYPTLFNRIRSLLTLVFALIFFKVSCEYVMESYEFGDADVVSGTSLWIMQLIIPYTFLSLAFRYLVYTIKPAMIEENESYS